MLNKFKKTKGFSNRQIISGLIFMAILIISSVYLTNLTPYKSPGFSVKSTQSNNQNLNLTEYVRAKVLKIESDNFVSGTQMVQVRILDGSDKGKAVVVERNYFSEDPNSQRLPIGSEILLTIQPNNGNQYSFLDRYRIPGAATLLLLLFILVIIVGRWRGFTSVAGLVISVGILSVFVIPRIVNGHAAFATCIEGALIIATVSIYIAHGFNKRTTIAYASTIITLIIVTILAAVAMYLTGITGNPGATVNAEQQTSLLQYAPHPIDLAGLFMGGIVIASLGALEDITTGQAAAVEEVHKANSKLKGYELYKKGLSVGREHIASLINTLGIIYVGLALPTIILTVVYSSSGPVLETLNDETVIEAVVRTIVPSVGLLLAVPLCTGLAAYILPKWYKNYGRV